MLHKNTTFIMLAAVVMASMLFSACQPVRPLAELPPTKRRCP